MKTKLFKERIMMLLILLIVPIIYFIVANIVTFDTKEVDSAILIIATFIVSMTIYYGCSILIMKFPKLMTKGIWQKPLLIISLGLIILIVLMFSLITISNYLDASHLLYRIIIYYASYPVLFVFIMMIDAFLSKILIIERIKRLFYSSISISICLAIMILFTLFQNGQ